MSTAPTLPRPLRAARTSRALIGGLAAVALCGALAGCGAASNKAAEKLSETIAEQSTGADVDIDTETGSVTVDDGEGGSFSAGTGSEVPADWPSDLLPIPDGAEILVVLSGGGQHSLSATADGSVAALDQKYSELLEKAGFSQGSRVTTESNGGQLVMTDWTNGNQRASITLSPGDDGTLALTLSYSTSG